MSLKHGLLGLLNQRPMTGYELDKEFKESLAHFWQAKASQIYRELDAMEAKGWLTSRRIIQEEKPNKRVYSLTDKGKAEFFKWLTSPGEDIQNATRVKSVFFMRLYFADQTSKEQALELLYNYHEQCLEGLREMDDVFESYKEANKIFAPEELIYSKLITLHGDMMRKTRFEWVLKAIAILEGKEEINF
jgi:DNA-binding PadR family transcriptional regulator